MSGVRPYRNCVPAPVKDCDSANRAMLRLMSFGMVNLTGTFTVSRKWFGPRPINTLIGFCPARPIVNMDAIRECSMLTKDSNDLITQTGPGTPGGKLLRSY